MGQRTVETKILAIVEWWPDYREAAISGDSTALHRKEII